MKQAAPLCLALVLAAASAAPAATVLIDWSNAASITNPAGDGKYWNTLGAVNVGTTVFDLAATAVVDSTGAATNMTVAVDFSNTTTPGAGFGGVGISGPAGADPFDEANAVADGMFVNLNSAGTATISLAGLANSTTYNISAIGGRAANGADGRITVLTGSTGSSPYILSNAGTVLNFSVTSSPSGVIVLDFSENSADGDTAATSATWNALSITAVPEPGAAVLAALGTLLLLRRRRF